MSVSGTVYTVAIRVAALAGRAMIGLPAAISNPAGKLHRGIRGLLDGAGQIEAWARTERDPSRPLVWFHAPSVGEGLQARAVIAALGKVRRDVQVVYTYFSPSAAAFAGRMPVDFAGYLPIDLPGAVIRALDAVRPAAIVFSKNEVWPNLVRLSADRGIPSLLLSATLPESSSRTRGPAAWLLRDAHARLTHVGAISPDDAARYERLGVDPSRVTLMGDARFDQVRERALRVDRGSPLLTLLCGAPGTLTLVAGSTWPPDEEAILEAVAGLRDSGDRIRLIVAPHEPVDSALESFEAASRARGFTTVRLAELESGRPLRTAVPTNDGVDIVLIDRVGILGDLYALADSALVGGGFGTAGLHSVLEPAAFGVPVVFGPNHSNAREAAELVRRGAAREVTGGEELEGVLREWIRDDSGRRSAGAAAGAYVEENVGAADRGASVIIEALDSRPPR